MQSLPRFNTLGRAIMKSIAKLLLLGAVAVAAIAVSAAPSEAAKKKAAACSALDACVTNCKGKTCEPMTCGADGKWHKSMSMGVCIQPDCARKCS
jgi:hypothetical protein